MSKPSHEFCPECGLPPQACNCFQPLDDDEDPDELDIEDALTNCHGFFEGGPGLETFVCMAAGSEDCDECPFNGDLGLTMKQLEEREDEQP